MPGPDPRPAPDDGGLRRPRVPPWTHVLAGAWVAGMLALGTARPEDYRALLQEDRWVEWGTVALFGAAGLFALRLAWRQRRPFDALVGAFCVFVAGEEFSWGQRLLGITPPDAFLEHNRQQELTLHNFADLFGEPKYVLMMALTGFGLVLPAAAATQWGRRLLARLGATAVRVPAAAWILAAVGLLWWYPLTLTGEWVEALAGALFVVAYAPGPGTAALAGGVAVVVAGLMTAVSGWAGGGEDSGGRALACARAETQALADDLALGRAATARLAGARSVHKRVFTAFEEGYIDREGLERYRAAVCGDPEAAARRTEYAIDPWGTAYWVDVDRDYAGGDGGLGDGEVGVEGVAQGSRGDGNGSGGDQAVGGPGGVIRIVVYSFGPDRRRDAPPGTASGDDIRAVIEIAP